LGKKGKEEGKAATENDPVSVKGTPREPGFSTKTTRTWKKTIAAARERKRNRHFLFPLRQIPALQDPGIAGDHDQFLEAGGESDFVAGGGNVVGDLRFVHVENRQLPRLGEIQFLDFCRVVRNDEG